MADSAPWLAAASPDDIRAMRTLLIDAAWVLHRACPDIDDVSSVSVSPDRAFAVFAASPRLGRPRFETVSVADGRVVDGELPDVPGDARAWLVFAGEQLARVLA
jgi:hypothetical protein